MTCIFVNIPPMLLCYRIALFCVGSTGATGSSGVPGSAGQVGSPGSSGLSGATGYCNFQCNKYLLRDTLHLTA